MKGMTDRLDDKIDILESFSKQDNLVTESTKPESCKSYAKKILGLL